MKTNTLKRTPDRNRSRAGFTMVEMTGVLAVIAILATMLVPKVLSAINDSRLNSTVGSLNAVKSATATYFGNTGIFTNASNFDLTLVSLEYLERPFACRIGNGSLVQVVAAPGGPGGTSGYTFDGVTTNTLTASAVVECLISNVPIVDAWNLSQRLDGTSLSAASSAANDLRGRVAYNFASGSGTVYVYMGHR